MDTFSQIISCLRIEELLEVAEAARARGAAVVAITAGHSPLARKADVALVVDEIEDLATHVPMVGRILHLLVIDILAVGVAMRRGQAEVLEPDARDDPADAGVRAPRPPGVKRAGPGITTAGPLARLTSHSR